METLLSCAVVPGEPESPAPRCALPSWPQEKLSLAVAKGLGCIQLLPAAPSKLLEGHALPGFTLEVEHNENTGWFHSTCQELGVIPSVTRATCAAARWQGYLYLPSRGAAAHRMCPLNADRSFALHVLVQTDVSVQQSSHPNAKAACSGSP